MNLHINVIRGSCTRGYFQQRGWEDVKHAKRLCIYMQIRILYCHLNVNLAEINLFINSLNVLWHVHIDHAAADILSTRLCCVVGSEIASCGFPNYGVFVWHSKRWSIKTALKSEHALSVCTVRLDNTGKKKLLCCKSSSLWLLLRSPVVLLRLLQSLIKWF